MPHTSSTVARETCPVQEVEVLERGLHVAESAAVRGEAGERKGGEALGDLSLTLPPQAQQQEPVPLSATLWPPTVLLPGILLLLLPLPAMVPAIQPRSKHEHICRLVSSS